MAELKMSAQPRTLTGRKVRQLRQQGLVPVVVYGPGQAPVNLQVSARQLELTLHRGGSSQLVQVEVEGGPTHNVLVREVQRHPVSHAYLHADFYAVNMNEKQEVSVPLVAVGKPTALAAGMMVLQAHDTVEIRALPADIPASIEVDITELDLERPITVADLPALPGVEYLDEPGEHLFSLIATREEVEEEQPEEVAEPEVVGRGREEEEE
ncbi:MAG TPA: 50S ribosomal protein L25 [Caldilineaceae bacterium]|nr:50S ribosomal protein L25 [Caldilineaceae bacterium]